MTRRTKSVILGLLISIGFMVWVFWKINFSQVLESMRGANYWWLLPNIALVLVVMYQRAWRWKSMAKPLKDVHFDKFLAATAVGFMANNVLPLRLGEFVRAYSLSKQDPDISKSASLAMIFTERIIFDLIVLLGIFGIVLMTTSLEMPPELKRASAYLLVVAALGYLFAVALTLWSGPIARFVNNRLTILPKLAREWFAEAIERFTLGLQFMRSPVAGAWVLLQSVLIWFVMGISNVFVFKAFGFDLPLEASFTTLAVVAIGITLPSSPGFVGVYHLAVILTLTKYGIDESSAAACAVVMHAAQYLTVTLFGLYFLKAKHLSLKEVEADAVDTESA